VVNGNRDVTRLRIEISIGNRVENGGRSHDQVLMELNWTRLMLYLKF
jgi:hypothetical protein